MAGRLGLQTIAEGVERLEQQQYLRAVGADAMQGFLHLRPAPAPDVERWLRTQPQTQQPHADHNIIPLPRRRTAEVRSPR
jgi:EAL domain-containing protein (putative c-di-GMP-specific phosphodiesterase class I)